MGQLMLESIQIRRKLMRTLTGRAAMAGVSAVAAVVLAPGLAMAARTGVHASATIQLQQNTPAYDFVDLPTIPVAQDHQAHAFTVTYRNDSGRYMTVAPQILVESAENRPFLKPSDVRLQQLNPATGHWHTVQLDIQTGTLYTSIPAAERPLFPGHTLSIRYRLTVVSQVPGAARGAVIAPRIVVVGDTTAAARK
jgi:hypothetical protein